MDCFSPGKLLVCPSPELDGGADALSVRLHKEFGDSFTMVYRISDVLKRNDLELPQRVVRALPIVANVPEGAEYELAERIRRLPYVRAALPDYLVRPSSPAAYDDAALATAVTSVLLNPATSVTQGGNCVVGVLDSGIDGTETAATVYPTQLDALNPTSAGKPPFDLTGHGSLVARIIGAVAPMVQLVSVKTFDTAGTISSVIAGLYLAHAAGPCDVINLSLSISCIGSCPLCNTSLPSAATEAQLEYLFQAFLQAAPNTVIVAAAGNNVTHLAMPAKFDDVIAVGSFDHLRSTPISGFHVVPPDRYILAPGGLPAQGAAFASTPGYSSPAFLHGTSFAAAFASGVAALILSDAKDHAGRVTPLPNSLATVLADFRLRADTTWLRYSSSQDGMGALRF